MLSFAIGRVSVECRGKYLLEMSSRILLGCVIETRPMFWVVVEIRCERTNNKNRNMIENDYTYSQSILVV